MNDHELAIARREFAEKVQETIEDLKERFPEITREDGIYCSAETILAQELYDISPAMANAMSLEFRDHDGKIWSHWSDKGEPPFDMLTKRGALILQIYLASSFLLDIDPLPYLAELTGRTWVYAKDASQIPKKAKTIYLGYDTGWIYPL